MPTRRRFPPPWSIEERPACYIVKDGAGQSIAYVRMKPAREPRPISNMMTRDEARRIAAKTSKHPFLLQVDPTAVYEAAALQIAGGR